MNLVDWTAVHKMSGIEGMEEEIKKLDDTIANKMAKEKQAQQTVYQLKDKG